MATFLNKRALTFDDVHMVPQKSDIRSRKTGVDLSVRLQNTNITLGAPFIASPMDTVASPRLAIEIQRNNAGIAILHRYCDIETQRRAVEEVRSAGYHVGAAVGISGDYIERANAVIGAGAQVICVDVAHGHHVLMEEALKKLRAEFPQIHIMAGNVATPEGYLDLSDWGANSVRLGVGSGCLGGNSLITMADGSFKKIYQIRVGDQVMDMHGTPRRVVGVKFSGLKSVVRIQTQKYYSPLLATPDHHFLTESGWECAGALHKSTIKLKGVGNALIKYKFYRHYGKVHTYDIETDGPTHTFIANGVVVHNSICSTRVQTGHGYPMFQNILDVAAVAKKAQIISDGGIRQYGDIVKALGAGADLVMMGSMFAGTDEAPGELVATEHGTRKTYRGMASKQSQTEWRGFHTSNEGVATTIPCKGPLKNVLDDMKNGVASGFSYSGAANAAELRSKAVFVEVSYASAVEATPHILKN